MNTDSVSRRVYEQEIGPWLPPKILDCHVHVTLAEHCGPISPQKREQNWALEVGVEQSWDQLKDNYRTLFPDKEVFSLVFGSVFREVYTEPNNEYVLQGASDPANRAAALFVTRPEWDETAIFDAVSRGFRGIKPYPDMAPRESSEVSIYEFVPRRQLAAVDELGAVLMLHLPRKGRLSHPDNVRELLEIHEHYPNIRFIVAHIGRAYCLPTAQKGLPHLAEAKGVYFDTAANLNPDVFQYALEMVGPDRLLFGSDLPITLMRGVREHVGEEYINYTDGDYSWNTDRKSPEEEANYTYFLYEELRALARAIERAGLGKDAVEKIMYSNAARLLGTAAGGGNERRA